MLLYASSIGAYSPAPKDRAVDESWPVDGIPTLYYFRQKAEVERRLDHFESRNPDIRVVRFRPTQAFKRESAEGLRRILEGRSSRVSWHGRSSSTSSRRSRDCVPGRPLLEVEEAYQLALLHDVHGAFNLAAYRVLDAQEVGRILNTGPVPVPVQLACAGARLSWQAARRGRGSTPHRSRRKPVVRSASKRH